ncbi:MAG: alpha/beta fold hydrolase [Candidatus Nitrosocosmicus sp.]
MNHFKSSYELFFALVVIINLVCSLLTSIPETNLVYSTTSFSQSLQQSQYELQSAINKEVQKTIANTISNINNSISDSNKISNNDSQTQDLNSSSAFQQKSLALDDIPLQEVRVGDINIAYKQIGQGPPILLISGSGNVMDVRPTHLLQELSKDHKVIIFDNRGVGNTTAGIKPFSIKQFANDTAGLVSALKLQKTDVLGFSMGSFVAQQLALTYPEIANHFILYGASCGGHEGTPQSPQVVKALSDFVNNQTENLNLFLEVTFPTKWMRENPNFSDTIPKTSEIILSTTLKKQFEINENWLSKNWTGVCDQLQRITKPTLIITGTEDQAIPSSNSLILAGEIPGAWLVQIRDAGHGLMYQYPKTFTEIVKTFLNITGYKMG